MLIVPNSAHGSDLAEIGWTPQARASSLQTRLARAMPKVAARPRSSGGSSGGGGSKATGRPKKTGEKTNAAGEREISYNDGGKVTVHKDGKATYMRADGTKVTGTYKEPVTRPVRPQGFEGDDEPQVIKRKEVAARQARAKAERDARQAKRDAKDAANARIRHTQQLAGRGLSRAPIALADAAGRRRLITVGR